MTPWTFQYTPPQNEYNFDWEGITAAYDWVQALKNTPQDPIFHAEGDVYIHTQMVLDALLRLEDYQHLPPSERSALFLAALLHDVAKPICTLEEDGRIRAPHHAKKGAQIARATLFRGIPNPVPFFIRETIVQFVRYHGLPLWYFDKINPQKSLLKASQLLNLKQLALLAEADVRGRICVDKADLLSRVELFREWAQEENCYEQPFPFQNGLHRFQYFRNADYPLQYIPYDDTQCEVILLCGLPGAGKNTWIANHAPALPVVSLDAIRRDLKIKPTDNQGIVLQTSKEQAKAYLRKQQSFIWNATNLIKQRRKVLIDLFVRYKAKVKIVYIETLYQTLLERNQTRAYPIPTKVLERFINKLEVPAIQEAHEVVYVVEN